MLSYDGEGKRVKKVTGAESAVFVYSNGRLVEERNSSTNALVTSYLYAGSQLLATETSTGTNYTVTDHLGSPRVVVNGSGTVVSRRDFLPFGEELFADGTYRKTSDNYSTTGIDAVRQRFTGYQKDTETGLDFAEARMYQNQHGRFTAIDPLLASGKSAIPQTFNRYSYVNNKPLRLVDPSGLQSGMKINVSRCSGSECNSRYDKRSNTVVVSGSMGTITVKAPEAELVATGSATETETPSLLATTITSAIVTFAENNGSELLFGKVETEHNLAGRVIGNTASLIQGLSEISAGAGIALGGGAEAVVTAPACATGVGCIAPAAGVGAAATGTVVAAHGTGVVINTLYNMSANQNPAQTYNDQGRAKIQTGEDALDQLEGITNAQENVKKGKGNAIIDSTKKSQQRVDNKNKKIRNLKDALDEYPD